MYYEESKKNLMALLRQNGCPSLFLTLSCAEFDWPELLKEIIETVQRRKVSKEYVDGLPDKVKNRLITENVVQSTIHFQKRIGKLFTLMKHDFFKGKAETFKVSSYFYRIEFQQRGAPHVHSLLWMKNQNNKDAPNFWIDPNDPDTTLNCPGSNKTDQTTRERINESEESDDVQRKCQEMESFADFLISTSPEEIHCDEHDGFNEITDEDEECDKCNILKDKVKKYQTHRHTFTCAKKRKTLTIKENEGHGRLDGCVKGPELTNISVCRFRFPQFPLNETKVVLGLSKDSTEDDIKACKADLNKITKYLVRQTHTESNQTVSENWETLKRLSFWEFLYEVGMFPGDKRFRECNDQDKESAKARYLRAISAGVQGRAAVILKRDVKDIFVNGYNKTIMKLHKANHDLQICIDQYSVAQYICGYLTKNESGISRLLKAVNEETSNLKQMDKLNALATVLDKHREVSIQEAIYRLLALQMTKSSVAVKYLSTVHPNFRDGLLRGRIEDLEENESIFHNSPHDYYENRPDESDEVDVDYNEEEQEEGYWDNLALSDFWSKYEIVYDKNAKKNRKKEKTKIISLKNGSFIRRRLVKAVLRYYLDYGNDEDLARGLLILFKPFRNEKEEIHSKDVKQLLMENREPIEKKRSVFEKYKLMTDLVSNIQSEIDANGQRGEDDEECAEGQESESTLPSEIEDFNNWARTQASKDLSNFKRLTDLCDMNKLRSNISTLNKQQRRLFDDFTERMVSTDINEQPCYLFLAGEAGTGKSHLVQILIEAVKIIKLKAGAELKKPPVIVMAPTANAALAVGAIAITGGFFNSAPALILIILTASINN